MNNQYSEVLWTMPDDQMYTVECKERGGRWETTNEFGTREKMKARALSLPEHRDVRVIRVSKYPPHSAVEVVFYREAERR